MSRDSDDLDEIAGAVADGRGVDWDAAMRSGEEREIVEQLRVIGEIAQLHREVVHGDVERDSNSRWGELELIEKIGEGTFGEVYRAWDFRLDREVALKLMRRDEGSLSSMASAVIREGRLLARVRHPNVVTVYGADRIDGRVGIWMEYIHGSSLDEVIRTVGAFSSDEAALIGIAVCSAVAAVHRAGVIHGDIKPQNVLREQGGRIVLMDFGAGHDRLRVPGRASESRALTPLYVAPEVLRGGLATFASDIYSVGVLLYHLVSGAYPVSGDTLEEVAAAHTSGKRTWLQDVRPDAPHDFRNVVEHALAADPAQRFATAGDMARALRAVLSPGSTTETPKPRPKTLPVAAALVAVAVLAAVGGVVWMAGRSNPTPVRFERLTFRVGRVESARFAPDQRTVLYTATFGSEPEQVYMTISGSHETRAIASSDAELLSVSHSGEMALELHPRFFRGYVDRGTLAQVSLAGGGTREVLPDIEQAEWPPSGRQMAIVREVAGRSRLEFPAGDVLYETGGWIDAPRFSPSGRYLAFIDHPITADDSGTVAAIDLTDAHRRARTLTKRWVSIEGLAWNPATGEIWFTATGSGNARAIQAVSVGGGQRTVGQLARGLTLDDIAEDGRVLATTELTRVSIAAAGPDGAPERDASWLDWSLARDLSADGRLLLFNESGEGGGENYSVYLRRLDSSDPPIRLGDGSALALSPDTQFALTRVGGGSSPRLVLLPTAAGNSVPIRAAGLRYEQWASWFPDARRVVFTATEGGRGTRLYVQQIPDGEPRCITPGEDGVALTSPEAVAPDGDRILGVDEHEAVTIFSASGKPPVAVRGAAPGELPIRWTADGGGVYVHNRSEIPLRITRIDLASGRRTLQAELKPANPEGVTEILRVVMTADASTYAYSFTRELSDLLLITGLK